MAQTTSTPQTGAPSSLPSAPALVLRAFGFWLTQYRRVWRGTAISTIVEPLGFLAAMGLGLGLLVDQGPGAANLDGVSYLKFIAPGLLAASAMQMTSFESTYPVMGAIKWNRQYHAMLATPLRVVDVLAGHLLFIVLRLLITTSVFLAIMVAFGAISSPWAVLCIPVGIATGFAYAPAIFAFSATRENDSGFAMLFRFGIVPMFLFSGTFFPVSRLPQWLQPAAWVTPLWHGVELARSLCLGDAGFVTSIGHVLYLVAWAAGGTIVARWTFTRRLVV